MSDHDDDHDHDHHRGLTHDLPKIAAGGYARRGMLGLLGGIGGIPEETAGPYPGDGSNGVNVLTESGIVRQDITTSFGTSFGTASASPRASR